MSYYDAIEAKIEALEAKRRELLVFKQKYKAATEKYGGVFIGGFGFYEKYLELMESYCVGSYQDAK